MNIKSLQALDAIYPKIKTKTANVRLLYKMSKLMRQVAADLQFHNEHERALLDIYAQKNEDGSYKLTDAQDGVLIIPEKIQEFQEKYAELMNMDYNNYDFEFTFDELEALELTFDEFQAFISFIKEDNE